LFDGKVHKFSQSAQLEAENLRFLAENGVRVPKVLGCKKNLLLLELLCGEPLPELIERGDFDPQVLAQALCDWLADFYAACPEISRGDINGRNFLFDGKVVYGVDFEEVLMPGSPAQDAGRLAAFLATYDTKAPEKQQALVLEFLQRFPAEIKTEFELARAAMLKRRVLK